MEPMLILQTTDFSDYMQCSSAGIYNKISYAIGAQTVHMFNDRVENMGSTSSDVMELQQHPHGQSREMVNNRQPRR